MLTHERGWTPLLMLIILTSCSYAPRAMIRNASGADVSLWPLGEGPPLLKAGETTQLVFTGYKRHEAFVERGGCLYTYPAPDYFQLPKPLKSHNAKVVVVINEDMTLSVRHRSKDGTEGPEILAAGFPLRPTTFCGVRSGR